MTTVLDGAGEGSAKASWVLMRRSKRRTCLGPQVHGQNLRRFRHLHRVDRKNRTGIGPHQPARGRAESPVISVVQAGYVGRSEVSEQQIAFAVNNRERMCRKMGISEASSLLEAAKVSLRCEIHGGKQRGCRSCT